MNIPVFQNNDTEFKFDIFHRKFESDDIRSLNEIKNKNEIFLTSWPRKK